VAVGFQELELDTIRVGFPEYIVVRGKSVRDYELTWNSEIQAAAHAAELEVFGIIGIFHEAIVTCASQEN
jgi:hypothetical protein